MVRTLAQFVPESLSAGWQAESPVDYPTLGEVMFGALSDEPGWARKGLTSLPAFGWIRRGQTARSSQTGLSVLWTFVTLISCYSPKLSV